MMAGRHYALFVVSRGASLLLGVMRPGEAMKSAKGDPRSAEFYYHFTFSLPFLVL